MATFEEIVARLEAEWDQAEADELAVEVADRVRGELARLSLGQRLRPLLGGPVAVSAHGAARASGRLLGVGPDWLLVGEDGGRDVVVPLASVTWVDGLTRATAAAGSEGPVAARTTLAMVLRGLVRDRAPVSVVLADGTALPGVLDRVGVDHLELAVVAPGEVRRRGAVTGVRAVPLAAVSVVRSA